MSMLIILLFGLASCLSVEDEQKTQSPFFYLSKESHIENLPLKATRADVQVIGVIAQVKITQLYQNRGTEVIEGVYIFPASTKAIVYGMQMLVEDRLLIATLYEKGEAKQKYEEAKSEGKTASLLEMARPNVYSMSVANIMPGDFVRVEIFYTELLTPNAGKYKFHYPAVVMPRFSGVGADPYPQAAYTAQGTPETYDFQFAFDVKASVPVSDLYSPTHIFNFKGQGCCEWQARLSPLSSAPGTKDVEIIFSLSGPDFTGSFLHYDVHGDDGFGSPFRLDENNTITWDTGSGENFFLAMVQPPKPELLPDPLPREYIFIVDSSGSMTGFPWNTSLKIFEELSYKLRPEVDYFNLLSFSDTNVWYSKASVKATYVTIRDALSWAQTHFGGGGTMMDRAVEDALAMSTTAGLARTYALLTDGGVTNENVIIRLVKDNIREANFFCFVIGSSPNRFLSGGVARVGRGEEYWVQIDENPDDYIRQFYQFSGHPLLTNVHVDFHEQFDAYDVQYPAGILLAERPIVVSGKYRGSIPSTALTVKGTQADGSEWQMALSKNSRHEYRPALLRMLKYFWAGIAIDDLRYMTNGNDYYHKDFDKKKMLELALKYNVLTEVTSFLAIDNKVRFNTTDTPVFTVSQPLPLPMGVSDAATGAVYDTEGSSGSDYSYKPSPSYPGGNGFSFSSGNCLTPTSVFAYFLAVIYCLLI